MSKPDENKDPRSLENTKEIIRIIESDHKVTIELIACLTTLRAGLRGVVITLASTVLGLAIAQSSWPIAAFGIPVVFAGYFAEARLEYMVRLAHDRAVRLERKIQAYLATLIETGVVSQDADASFQREIDTYQFGSSRSLRGPTAWNVIKKSKKDVMTWVYVAFIIALLVSALIIGIRSTTKLFCIETGSGVIESQGIPTVRSGFISVITCPEVHPGPHPAVQR
jgi:hypothetical protein